MQRCMVCLYGTIENGICTRCHRKAKAISERNADALPLGYRLNERYMLADVLGRGGFGITYAAWDSQKNRRVAIKELYPQSMAQRLNDRKTIKATTENASDFKHAYEGFENEAALLMQMQGCVGVLQVYDSFAANGTFYYVMEYLEGEDLNSYLQKNGPMQWNKLWPIAYSMLGALDQLHSKNLIHRDVSPDNIFLASDGKIWLIDFGSVRIYYGNTRGFSTFLKRNFAPFEQYSRHGRQGPWTDIYALSVTLYYALTCKLPPIATERKLKDNVIPLQQLCPSVPPKVSEIIRVGMAVEIENRWQSARAMLNALQAVMPPSPTLQSKTQVPPKDAFIPHTIRTLFLIGIAGYFRGKKYEIKSGSMLRIGRWPDCQIRYPDKYRGVSHYQCSILLDANRNILVRDDGSSYGTWLETTRMVPNIWYKSAPRLRLIFVNGQEQFVIQEQ